jgi:F-type H+-transporting ATPase subunit alpha
MKKVAGSLRLDLAQYRELAAFSQFGSELDEATRAQLTRGERMVEILKQEQFAPCPLEKQVMIIYVGTHGYLDEIPLELVKKFEVEFYLFMEKEYPDVPHTIATTKDLDPKTMDKLDQAAAKFKTEFKTKYNLK